MGTVPNFPLDNISRLHWCPYRLFHFKMLSVIWNIIFIQYLKNCIQRRFINNCIMNNCIINIYNVTSYCHTVNTFKPGRSTTEQETGWIFSSKELLWNTHFNRMDLAVVWSSSWYNNYFSEILVFWGWYESISIYIWSKYVHSLSPYLDKSYLQHLNN